MRACVWGGLQLLSAAGETNDSDQRPIGTPDEHACECEWGWVGGVPSWSSVLSVSARAAAAWFQARPRRVATFVVGMEFFVRLLDAPLQDGGGGAFLRAPWARGLRATALGGGVAPNSLLSADGGAPPLHHLPLLQVGPAGPQPLQNRAVL